MKQGKVGITQIAGIVLIFLVLIILVISLTGLYGQGIKNMIKGIFGIQTELETTHEQNQKITENFRNLIEQINECKSSSEKTCGCSANLNNFNPVYEIRLTDNEIRLLNMKNERGRWSKEDAGILMDKETLSINCYWNNKLQPNKFERILFLKGEPYIFKPVWVWTSITNRGNAYHFTHTFNILKKDGKICWLTDKVKEKTIENIEFCPRNPFGGSGKFTGSGAGGSF